MAAPLFVALATVASVDALGALCNSKDAAPSIGAFPDQEMPANFRVVFHGDQGTGSDPEAVMAQIREFDPHAYVINGDFDYKDDPEVLDAQIQDAFGDRYPLFASIGNHDDPAWDGSAGYRSKLWARFERSKAELGDNLHCQGYGQDSLEEDIGIFTVCKIFDLLIVITGVGERGDREQHYDFLDAALDVPAAWKVTMAHKNMRDYQTGSKTDDIGWETMEITREHGAWLLTSHEHSYARSHLMANFESKAIAARNQTLVLTEGESFVLVNGLAGKDVRGWQSGREQYEHWAVAASGDGVCQTDYATGRYECDRSDKTEPGATYCTFNVDGQADQAECYFMDLDGKVHDAYALVNAAKGQRVASRRATCTGTTHREYTVASCCDDATENLVTGAVSKHEDVLALEPASAVALRFAGADFSGMRSARLQMAGAVDGTGVTDILIRAEVGASAPFAEEARDITGRKLTASAVVWAERDEDAWEHYSHWASPDVSELVAEVMASPEYAEGDPITFVLFTKGASRFAHAHDGNMCVAPTLTVAVEC